MEKEQAHAYYLLLFFFALLWFVRKITWKCRKYRSLKREIAQKVDDQILKLLEEDQKKET